MHQDSANNSNTSIDDQHKLDFDMYTAGFNTKFGNQSFDVALTCIFVTLTFSIKTKLKYLVKKTIFFFMYN